MSDILIKGGGKLRVDVQVRGTAVIALVLTLTMNIAARGLVQSNGERATPERGVKDWTLVRMGNGWTKSGYPFSVNTYKGPAGQVILFSIIHCESPDRAKREFQDTVAEASSVVEQGPILDKEGHVSGQRAVLTVDKSGQKTSFTIARMVFGSPDVKEMASYSKEDVLEFERVHTRR